MNCAPGLMCFEVTRGEFRCLRQAPTPDARPADARLPDAMMGAAPDTTIVDRPPAMTNVAATRFTFTSNIEGATFQCRVDTGTFSACTSPLMFNATSGRHTFEVRAFANGQFDPSPASYMWELDSLPPDTTITSGPEPRDSAPSDVTFTFTSEAGATFTCQLDQGAMGACTSPRNYAGLDVGAHVFRVFATDRFGNADPTPAQYEFTVTRVVPLTAAVCPPQLIQGNEATVEFSATMATPPYTFRCSLDGAQPDDCTSPLQLSSLVDGLHVVTVFAVDSTGASDPSPERCEFTTDATPPTVEITSPTVGARIGTAHTFTYLSSNETGLSASCVLNGTPVTCGTSTFIATGMTVGPGSFSVTVRDLAGNTATDSVTFEVVAGPPVVITLPPPNGNFVRPDGDATFEVVGNFPNVSFVCRVNDAEINPCTSPVHWEGLANGATLTIEVTATDLDTQTVGPTAIRVATVDGEGPTVSFNEPQNDIIVGLLRGSVQVNFSCSEKDPLTGATIACVNPTYECKITPEGSFTTCGEMMTIDPLIDGRPCLTVIPFDSLGNPGDEAEVCIRVDGIGPDVLEITQKPTEEAVCPTARDHEVIKWTASDANPYQFQNLHFTCSLNDGPERPCRSTGPKSGEYSWTGLQEGRYELRIIAYDPFDNAGPPDPDGSLADKGVVVVFFVDASPPVVTEVDIVHDPNHTVTNADGTFAVTSTGTSLQTDYAYGDVLVTIEENDGNDPDELPDNLPVTITLCNISSLDPNDVNCLPCTGPAEQPVDQETVEFECNFNGLKDSNNNHLFTVRAADECLDSGGSQSVPATARFIVDTTPDVLTLEPMTDPTLDDVNDPSLIVDHDANAPTGNPNFDITDGTFVFNWDAADRPVGGDPAFDSSDDPHRRQCQITASGGSPGAFNDCTENQAFDVAGEGLHTLTVAYNDAVGNPDETSTFISFNFYVDRSFPTLTDFLVRNTYPGDPNEPEGCLSDAGGLGMTDRDGRIIFSSIEEPASVPDYVTYRCELLGGPEGVNLPPVETCVVANGQIGNADCNCLPTQFGNGRGFAFRLGTAEDSTDETTGDVSGAYMLLVTATDGVGHRTSVTHNFVVDESRPDLDYLTPSQVALNGYLGIVPLMPTAPPADPADDPTDFADTTGNFSSDEDAATAAVRYECGVDTEVGVLDPDCSGLINTTSLGSITYPISGDLEEIDDPEAHNVQIRGTDCVGNVNLKAPEFFRVDKFAPKHTNDTPPGITQVPMLVDGKIEIAFDITDTITNVETLLCDFDNDLPVPATCGTPALTLGSQTAAGTSTVIDLAPGEHLLEYTVTDIWGHTRTYSRVFNIVHGPDDATGANSGHAILIGHDFEVNDIQTGAILGNSVWFAEAVAGRREYGRPVHVLLVHGGGTTAVTQRNIAEEICQRLEERTNLVSDDPSMPVDYDCTDADDPNDPFNSGVALINLFDVGTSGANAGNLRTALYGYDVVVLADLNDSGLAANLGNNSLFSDWTLALKDKASAGGTVILLDGASSDNFLLFGLDANPNQLIEVTDATAFDSDMTVKRDCLDRKTADMASVCDFPGAPGVCSPDILFDYSSPSSGVRFTVDDPKAAVIFSARLPGGFAECLVAPDGGYDAEGRCAYRPVVVDRKYFAREGEGPIFATAWDSGMRRSNDYAFIQDENGLLDWKDNVDPNTPPENIDGNCRLREDGTFNYSLIPNNGMVTIVMNDTKGAKPQEAEFTFAPNVTIRDMQPGDRAIIGNSKGRLEYPTTEILDLPTYESADHYAVTNGCDADYDPFVGNVTVPTLFTSQACVYQSGGMENMDVVVFAMDTDNSIIAHAQGTAIGSGGFFTIESGMFGGFEESSRSDYTITTSSLGGSQLRDSNAFYAFNTGEVNGGTGVANRLLHQQRSWEEESGLTFALTGDSSVAAFHALSSISFPRELTTQQRRPVTVMQTTRQMPTGAGESFSGHLAAVLDVDLDAKGPRPRVIWGSNAPPGSTALSLADAGFAVMSWTTGDGCFGNFGPEGGVWWMSLPPRATDDGLFQYPELPSFVDTCFKPVSTGQAAEVVGFCEVSGLAPDEVRLNLENLCPLDFGTRNPVNEDAPNDNIDPFPDQEFPELGEINDFAALAASPVAARFINNSSTPATLKSTYSFLPGYCGDGRVLGGRGYLQSGSDEECDGEDLDERTCLTELTRQDPGQGTWSGDLSCTGSCKFDVSQCERCGDGDVQNCAGEVCDGTFQYNNCAGQTVTLQCATTMIPADDRHGVTLSPGQTYTTGTLGCCTAGIGPCDVDGDEAPNDTDDFQGNGQPFDACHAIALTECRFCGNGQQETGESCDTNDLEGGDDDGGQQEDCDSQYPCPMGLTCDDPAEGTLGCSQACGFDTSQCRRCGDNLLAAGFEECDTRDTSGCIGTSCTGTVHGQTCITLGYETGALSCDNPEDATVNITNCTFNELGCGFLCNGMCAAAAGETCASQSACNNGTGCCDCCTPP